jgi:hypothetical protein
MSTSNRTSIGLRRRGGDCGCGGDESAPVTGGGSYEKGAVAFGRGYSVLGAIIGVIIAIICIFLGVSKLHDPHTSTATATVTKVTSCVTSAQGGADAGISYNCVVDATYPVGGKAYKVTGLTVDQSAPLQVGSTFTIHYDPSNPQSAVYELSPRGTGWALIGFGLLLGGITTGIAVMTFESKDFAAGYGTVEGVSMVARAL